MECSAARIIGIMRHRLMTDGDGVTTLVAFHGCPLRCRYCLNPQSLVSPERHGVYTAEQLYEATKIDELYFLATGGGGNFGGGEPALHPEFISRFRELCGAEWHLTLETSLNVPQVNIETLIPLVDSWIIDIKDMNPEIYKGYTGVDNSQVLSNLNLLSDASCQADCTIRLPHIPGHNTGHDQYESRRSLSALGFAKFDQFTYKITKSLKL